MSRFKNSIFFWILVKFVFVWKCLNVKFDKVVEDLVYDCLNHSEEGSFRLKIQLLRLLTCYSFLERFYVIYNNNHFGEHQKFTFYDHHMLIFGSKAQDVIVGCMFLAMISIYKQYHLRPNEALLKIYLKIFHQKTVEDRIFRKQTYFYDYLKSPKRLRTFNILNSILLKSFYNAFRIDLLLFPYMTIELFSFYQTTRILDTLQKLSIFVKYFINSSSYYLAYYFMAKYCLFASFATIFYPFLVKIFFINIQKMFRNSKKSLLELRMRYMDGLNLFFNVNSYTGPVLFAAIACSTPAHAVHGGNDFR